MRNLTYGIRIGLHKCDVKKNLLVFVVSFPSNRLRSTVLRGMLSLSFVMCAVVKNLLKSVVPIVYVVNVVNVMMIPIILCSPVLEMQSVFTNRCTFFIK